MSSELGTNIKVSVFGQSHAPAIGVTVDGLPAGEAVDLDRLQAFLDRRAPGRGDLGERLLEQGVLIRPCGNFYGLSQDYYRTCVGRPGQNRRLLREAEKAGIAVRKADFDSIL